MRFSKLKWEKGNGHGQMRVCPWPLKILLKNFYAGGRDAQHSAAGQQQVLLPLRFVCGCCARFKGFPWLFDLIQIKEDAASRQIDSINALKSEFRG